MPLVAYSINLNTPSLEIAHDIAKMCIRDSTNAVKEAQNQELLDFDARLVYEMGAVCIMSHLLIQDATKAPELFAKMCIRDSL